MRKAEKSLDLYDAIFTAATKPGDTVLELCSGSGVGMLAAIKYSYSFPDILIDLFQSTCCFMYFIYKFDIISSRNGVYWIGVDEDPNVVKWALNRARFYARTMFNIRMFSPEKATRTKTRASDTFTIASNACMFILFLFIHTMY